MTDTIWTVLIILCVIIFFGMYVWAKEEREKQKARKKSKAAKGIDCTGVDIIYTDGGEKQRIAQGGHEIREITYRKRKGA